MAISKPNLYIKHEGKLSESFLVKERKLEKKRLSESKELVDKIHPEDEEYSAPHEDK